MKYTHKLCATKIFSNGSSRNMMITFESECSNYGEALLSVIAKDKSLHDCFISEPVTCSPVTFDLTNKVKGATKPFLSDRYFLTFNELRKFIDDAEHDDNIIECVKQPFCRVLFSNAGNFGEFLNRKINTSLKPQSVDTLFFKPVTFKDIESSVFNSIKNGTYYNSKVKA